MKRNFHDIINELAECHNTSDDNLALLLEAGKDINNDPVSDMLSAKADAVRRQIYRDDVYIRGLIEFTNYCKNNCFYCGIRRDNRNAERYRLTKDEILDCCATGYSLGFRTFVLQGGEDMYFTDDLICDIVSGIRQKYPDCAITLSVGEKSRDSYKRYFDAGVNRYLLRHETADCSHYSRLHPKEMSLHSRKECLYNLKDIGYQVGAGFMVGSPYQTTANLILDLHFLQELEPDMVGIGPFIAHSETPFSSFKNGGLTLTLRLISIIRLMLPYALIPATTALGTIQPNGRELGLKAGANVVMPNLSPVGIRKLYQLYDNKICTGEESAQCIKCLTQRVNSAGYNIVTDIGNVKKEYKK